MRGTVLPTLMRLCALAVLAACKALPPPPALPPHAGTQADREGTTTAMLVVGFAGELLGGGGLGVAVRVEHQETERTTWGLELTGGRGDQGVYEDGSAFRHWLLAARAYGRFMPARDHDVSVSYGLGLSAMATGLITGTVHGGAAVSYTNDSAIPVGALGLALAVPLRTGRAFGDPPFVFAFGPPEPRPLEFNGLFAPEKRSNVRFPKTELFLAFDLGLVVPLGDTGNRLSADLGFAYATRGSAVVMSASVAEAQRFDP
jgi:hypothetical protein